MVTNLPARAGDARDSGLIPGLGVFPGVGNSSSFQRSCLESSMDRGAWQATVHGVTKSWTRHTHIGTCPFGLYALGTLSYHISRARYSAGGTTWGHGQGGEGVRGRDRYSASCQPPQHLSPVNEEAALDIPAPAEAYGNEPPRGTQPAHTLVVGC